MYPGDNQRWKSNLPASAILIRVHDRHSPAHPFRNDLRLRLLFLSKT